MTLSEKAAYIQGLADGLDLDESTKEGKLLAALIDLVGDIADAIEEIDEDLDTLNDYTEEIDEDLGNVEEVVYDCECDCDEDDYECDGNCCDCDEDCELADGDYFEVECPSCGEVVCFDDSIDPEDLACPACGEKFECIIPVDDEDAE